ncbi:MAG: hypothetical protein IPM82_20065 [Saprospiraceae bacterium]|nr:hypothetical protein [Saprospiraceae bacterium]
MQNGSFSIPFFSTIFVKRMFQQSNQSSMLTTTAFDEIVNFIASENPARVLAFKASSHHKGIRLLRNQTGALPQDKPNLPLPPLGTSYAACKKSGKSNAPNRAMVWASKTLKVSIFLLYWL